MEFRNFQHLCLFIEHHIPQKYKDSIKTFKKLKLCKSSLRTWPCPWKNKQNKTKNWSWLRDFQSLGSGSLRQEKIKATSIHVREEAPTSSGQSPVRLVGCWGERATKDDRFRASYLTNPMYHLHHQLESYMWVKLLCQITTSAFLTQERTLGKPLLLRTIIFSHICSQV